MLPFDNTNLFTSLRGDIIRVFLVERSHDRRNPNWSAQLIDDVKQSSLTGVFKLLVYTLEINPLHALDQGFVVLARNQGVKQHVLQKRE